MKPEQLGQSYDALAGWWRDVHRDSRYGMRQLSRALEFVSQRGDALDVGCGSSSRMVNFLENSGFRVTGIDVSSEMIRLAREGSETTCFLQADICDYQLSSTYDLIVGWDSLFHLPIAEQAPVLKKLCNALNPRGVLIYSLGDDIGEHRDTMEGQTMHYSSLGISENLRLLDEFGLECKHLELDQFPPHNHVFIIAVRMAG